MAEGLSTESEARRMLNTFGITDQNIIMDNLPVVKRKEWRWQGCF